jgi:hypothetical protein
MTTSKGPASESSLGDLHTKVAKVMINALDKVIAQQENPTQDENGNDVEVVINPALISVAVKFLDSNKITCAPEIGNTMSELEQKLAAKAKKRRQVGNVVHLDPDTD